MRVRLAILASEVLTVRNTKFYKSRLVPVAPQLANAMRTYAERRSHRPLLEGMESAFFTNRDGTQVRKHNVDHAFKRLLEITGIGRKDDGRRAPCLHALRHYVSFLTMSGISRIWPGFRGKYVRSLAT